MIDEKKLIEDIRKKIIPENFGERCDPLDVIYGILQVIDEQPKDEWTPCSEGLPKKSGHYIATISDNGSLYVADRWFVHKEDYDLDKSEWRELVDGEEVMAWKFAPEPYKEGE